MAIAKAELDKALADASALGTFEQLVGLMADKVEGDLDRVMNKFGEIFALSGKPVDLGTSGGTVPAQKTFDVTGALKQETPFVSSGGTGGFAGSMLATSGSVSINVTTGAVLGTEQDVENAVATAITKAQQRGLSIV